LLVVACGGESQRNPAGDAASGGTASNGAAATGNASSGAGAGVGGTRSAAGATNAGRPSSGGDAGAGAPAEVAGGFPGEVSGGSPGQGGEPNQGGAGGEPSLPSCDPIVFDDADFEAAVRASVNNPLGPLSSADVAGLTFVAASGLTSIRGAECLTDLTSFDIGGLPWGHVTDLSPLAHLEKLEDVSVGYNPLASVAALGNLPKLRQLFMSHVPVTLDLTPLGRAQSLDLLFLEFDTLVDLAPLGDVKTLRTLYLRDATLQHPEGTAELTSLEDLDASGVFSDAAPLAALTKLKKLRLGRKALANFSALATLTNLEFLDINQAQVTDYEPVSKMKKLRQFSAFGQQVSDLSPLRDLPLLDYLVVIDNQVTDLTPLVQNQSLGDGDALWLQKNPFSCVDQAANIAALKARGVEVNSDCP
jgi:Leucine-rich repeat (LRR) protein